MSDINQAASRTYRLAILAGIPLAVLLGIVSLFQGDGPLTVLGFAMAALGLMGWIAGTKLANRRWKKADR